MRSFGDPLRVEIRADGLIQLWEEPWVKHQPFLLQQGYLLPKRYDPNWRPSWLKTHTSRWKKYPDLACMEPIWPLLDAIRVSDGRRVVIKVVRVDEDVPILEYLNSPKLLQDPRNHTVPLLDKIHVPNDRKYIWIVMPYLLLFDCYTFPFTYVSEIVECIGQLLEGLEFMHEHHIAHRDACYYNLMVDSSKLLPDGNMSFFRGGRTIDWKHEVQRVERRSVAPLQYFFIDFETAIHYPAGEQQSFLCVGRVGQERDCPDLSDTIPYNPFKLDIYQLGMIFPKLFRKYELGMEFLRPLHEAMTHVDAQKRPTAAEANQLFKGLISSFTEDDMSRRIWTRMDLILERCRESTPKTSSKAFLAHLLPNTISRIFH